MGLIPVIRRINQTPHRLRRICLVVGLCIIILVVLSNMITQTGMLKLSFTRVTMVTNATVGSQDPKFTSDELIYFTTGKLPQDSEKDPEALELGLAEYIKNKIIPPSGHRLAPDQVRSSLMKADTDRPRTLDRLFSGKRGGFYIDCGAADGEYLSNSLFFELSRDWNGILIEANPEYVATLLQRKRNAFMLPTCLSTRRSPSLFNFTISGVAGGIQSELSVGRQRVLKKERVQTLTCFPLNAVLAAINVTRVDYLSLDVEGAELSILKTIDFNRIFIDIIFAEYFDPDSTHDKLDRLKALREFFNSTKLYKEVMLLPESNQNDLYGIDILFRRI